MSLGAWIIDLVIVGMIALEIITTHIGNRVFGLIHNDLKLIIKLLKKRK